MKKLSKLNYYQMKQVKGGAETNMDNAKSCGNICECSFGRKLKRANKKSRNSSAL